MGRPHPGRPRPAPSRLRFCFDEHKQQIRTVTLSFLSGSRERRLVFHRNVFCLSLVGSFGRHGPAAPNPDVTAAATDQPSRTAIIQFTVYSSNDFLSDTEPD